MSTCGCGLDLVSEEIDEALLDERVKRIILDFNSPGGAVTGIPELGRKIAGIVSKETIGFTDSECCSGALWLGMQCQRFYATQSSSVGSIGVWCAILDISRQMQNEGLNMQEISAGRYKTMGAFWKPLTDEEREMLQRLVDKIYGQFKEAVNLRRQVEDEFMQGQIFDGEEAVAAGISDGMVDGIDEVIEE
jgi:protease-4